MIFGKFYNSSGNKNNKKVRPTMTAFIFYVLQCISVTASPSKETPSWSLVISKLRGEPRIGVAP